MRFQKPSSTIDEQIAKLRERGMLWLSPDLLERWLTTVGYYRLSAYWLPFEEEPDNGQTRSKRFRSETYFEDVVRIYVFDRKLRLLVMEAIERLEISLRSRWTHRISLAYGAHAHLDGTHFVTKLYRNLLRKLRDSISRSRETFIEHYFDNYTEPTLPPLWAVTEIMSFGELSKWVEATKDLAIQTALARDMGLPTAKTLTGVFHVLAFVRNICAHHGRLWNRRTVKRIPKIARFGNELVNKSTVTERDRQIQNENTIYNVLTILIILIRHQSSDATFPKRVKSLIEELSDGERRAMGFPERWRERQSWK